MPLLVQEIEDEPSVPTKLELTPVEDTLRTLLLDVAKHIDAAPTPPDAESQVPVPDDLAKQPITLRFTGGWVRDKLLGVESHDIDVAINKMTGYHFGLRLKEYLEIPGNLEKYGLESIAANEKQSQKAGATNKSKTVGGLHKIEANPEKSKHLETTTMRILGLDIDLVNLRKETYSDDSRNPQMEFGTPEEDALRRDATVNAMFYNINTEQIEDFTGRGHEDMARKLIRTPLEPYQTFKDDPLRVLRLIRFASRLEYTIDDAALQAMGNEDIKHELRRKISRERVGTELEKALLGPHPHEAMRLVFSLGLYDTIFSDPMVAKEDHYTPDIEGWSILIDTLEEILNSGGVLQENLARDSEESYLAWILAAVVPYRDAPQPEPTEPGKKAPPPVPVTVAREGIKTPNKISDVINSSVRNQTEISDLVDKVYDKKRRPDKKFEGEDPAARDVLGMAIRRWGASWRSQVIYSLLVEFADNQGQIEGECQSLAFYTVDRADHAAATERKYIAFIEHLRALGIADACALKPLLDGKALAKAIGTPPGPWMKDALDVVMAWQLRNPDTKDAQQAIEEVKNHQANGELTFDLVRHFLKLTIRPLFIKATPKTVTEQGRKITTKQLPPKMTLQSMDDTTNKPWKTSKDSFVLDILKWTIQSLNEQRLPEIWPLVIPPILTLLDDWETKYKQLGTELLTSLLHSTPTSLLNRTGLGEVFEEALLPCLTYIPTITPEEESLPLLQALYPALLTLCKVRFPDEKPRRVKFLDSVIRKGIIYGYTHCSPNHPNIIEILFSQLGIYLDELGIDSVKHIKFILPMLTESLSDSMGTATIPMLESSARAMQALIRDSWPRMVVYRGEVLKGVMFCWLKIQEMEGMDVLKGELRECVKLLRIAVKGQEEEECDFEKEIEGLVGVDGRLRGLFA
ncbi:Nucleotidyltransferase lcsQ [Pseudocercospora fuligena]|uniref:Nucleotidyltransferase lcsQ n=1 Tax=Pseudocercospora fuligena TaxID=685502 RepID=A0A8H6RSW9_9PEZI|nr:Nucleotidyltransferase lcsQ [Pseudocercospora fuligena]